MSSSEGSGRQCFLRALMCLAAAGLLAGCGFQPLHGSYKGSAGRADNIISDMAYVEVAPMADRVGQMLRNQLLDLLHPGGPADRPLFRLTVILTESLEGLAFEQDDSATRYNLRLTAHFRLSNSRGGIELLNGTTRAIAAYNVVRSDYANLISKRDARKRTAFSVAEGIQRRIAFYFSRQRE